MAEDVKQATIVQEENKKHYIRTAIIEALALAGGTAWYWLDRDRQVADWDFPSWSERLTADVIRYDNNPFHVNFAWHAANGASFHFIARANNLSFLESVGAGVLTSLTWEYALEYREKVSLNDLMFTTGAGIPMGEFIHVMGRYLHEDPDVRDNAIARWSAGFPISLAKRLDGLPQISLQKKPRIWHRFHLDYRLALSDITLSDTKSSSKTESQQLHSLHFDGKFVRLPRYLRSGTWGRFYHDAEFSELAVDVSVSPDGSGTKIFAETGLLGWFSQDISGDAKALSHATQLGIAMAYRYRREELGLWQDKVGVLHFPGLAGDLHLQWKDFSLETKARLHLDFVGINALSNQEWNQQNPDERGKSILRKQGYYYGYGASVALRAELGYRRWRGGASLWKARYSSDEGLDRVQEKLSVDQHSSDEVLDTRLWLRVQDLPFQSYIGLSYERRTREGRLEGLESSATLQRAIVELGIAL